MVTIDQVFLRHEGEAHFWQRVDKSAMLDDFWKYYELILCMFVSLDKRPVGLYFISKRNNS